MKFKEFIFSNVKHYEKWGSTEAKITTFEELMKFCVGYAIKYPNYSYYFNNSNQFSNAILNEF